MTTLFAVVQMLVVATALFFCTVGFVSSLVRRRHERQRTAAFGLAASVVLDEGADVDLAAERLAALPIAVLADVLQTLSVDLAGEAQRRMRLVAIEAGLGRRVARASRRRSWRRRGQAAHLLVLFPADASIWRRLLSDRHPNVRARAIDSITPDAMEALSDELVAAFEDPSPAVRAAAQHALVRGGAAAIPAVVVLLDRLHGGDRDANTMVLVAEVAAQLMSHRLAAAVLAFAEHPEPRLRLLVATCLGNGTFPSPESYLVDLLEDSDAAVRAEAVRSVGRVVVHGLAPKVGRCLSDRSWQVRRNAGSALLELGAVGRLLLRAHLNDPDPFARDMALHSLGQSSGLTDVLSSSSRWEAA